MTRPGMRLKDTTPQLWIGLALIALAIVLSVTLGGGS